MYGKTSVTLTGDELFYLKVAIGMDIKNVASYMEDGDPNGVWKRELDHLESAYNNIMGRQEMTVFASVAGVRRCGGQTFFDK